MPKNSKYKPFVDKYILDRNIEYIETFGSIRSKQLSDLKPSEVKFLFTEPDKTKRDKLIRKKFSIPQLGNKDYFDKHISTETDSVIDFINNNRIDRGLDRVLFDKEQKKRLEKIVDNAQRLSQTTAIQLDNKRLKRLSKKLGGKYKNQDVGTAVDDMFQTLNPTSDYSLLSKMSENNFRGVDSTIAREFSNDEMYYFEGATTPAGTKTGEMRSFCRSNVGREFSEEEIEAFNSMSWPGKIPARDVFLVCGGYNCRHSFLAVAEEQDFTTTDEHTDAEYKRYSTGVQNAENQLGEQKKEVKKEEAKIQKVINDKIEETTLSLDPGGEF